MNRQPIISWRFFYMFKIAYKYRYELFLVTQLAILFGSLVFDVDFYQTILSPFFFIANLIAGILLISNKKKLMWFFIILLSLELLIFGFSFSESKTVLVSSYLKFFIYFLFYIFVTYEIIKNVWIAKLIGRDVILGLISGYISLGFIGYFIFLSVNLADPNSFLGLNLVEIGNDSYSEGLMYFSYITLLTIGYGDITPITAVAQKATIFVGLTGQFYLVILTAITVGKYLNQLNKS